MKEPLTGPSMGPVEVMPLDAALVPVLDLLTTHHE